MTDSRELAAQAFSHLQNALDESEAKRAELQQQLKQQRPSKSRLEEQLDVLTHRLQRTEEELERSRRSAGQLEDVIAQERAETERLRASLAAADGLSTNSAKEVLLLRQKTEEFQEIKLRFGERIGKLKKELDDQNLATDRLQTKLDASSADRERLGELLQEREQQIAELVSSIGQLHDEQSSTAQLRDEHARQLDELGSQLEAARLSLQESAHVREQLQDRDAKLTELSAIVEQRAQEHRTALEERDAFAREVQSLQEQLRELSAAFEIQAQEHAQLQSSRDEQQRRYDELASAMNQQRESSDAATSERDRLTAELAQLGARLLETQQSHEEASHACVQLNDEVRALREEAEALHQQIETQDQSATVAQQRIDELGESVRSAQEYNASLEQQLNAALESTALLEQQINDERLERENLNELANERRESVSKITEKYEEAQERYEDAKWHLEKAQHFERLVRRRKSLIANLIATIRAKQRANTALKAGLDGLRNYKATATQKQQQLLQKIETLETALAESREKLASASHTKRSTDEPTDLGAATGAIRGRLDAQAQTIETLEQELKKARVVMRDHAVQSHELQRLYEDLETKNAFIGTLRQDIEKQQRLQTELRRREIELQNMTSTINAHAKHIDALTRENHQLRQSGDEVQDVAGFQQQIRELDGTIDQLSNRLAEYEQTIDTLNDAVDHWKRKYDFLAAEAPYGFDSAAKS